MQNNRRDNKKRQPSPNQQCPYCEITKATPRHIKEQLCRPVNKRTYCRSCNETFSNRQQLLSHLTTREHMSRMIIDNNPNEVVVNVLKSNEEVKKERIRVLELDPYLTGGEVNQVAAPSADTFNNKLTVKFGDGKMYRSTNGLNSTVNIEPAKPGMTIEETKIVSKQEKSNEVIIKTGLSYENLVKHDEAYPQPTERQNKIIMWLAQWQSAGPDIMRQKLKLILEKIGLDDADFLVSHLRYSRLLTMPAKQIYCAYIDSVVRVLTNERNRGIETFAGKDIIDFVVKLTK